MPIYEYRCERGHTFEVIQRFTDDPVAQCEVCGAAVQRVFHPVAVHFKGSGFYNTDYGKKQRGGADGGSDGAAEGGDSKPKKDKPATEDKPKAASSSSD